MEEIKGIRIDHEKKTATINEKVVVQLTELRATKKLTVIGFSSRYCWIDEKIGAINKSWRVLHLEMIKHCKVANIDVNQLYQMILLTDRLKRKFFIGNGFSHFQTDEIWMLFVGNGACHDTGRGLKKTEAFLDFLISRKEAEMGELDERTMSISTLNKRRQQEEQHEKVYILPSTDKLAEMSLMELQLEHQDAIEKRAKRVIIKKLEQLMAVKKTETRSRKSELDLVLEAARNDRLEALAEEKMMGKGNKKGRKNGKGHTIWIDPKTGAEYVDNDTEDEN